MALPMAVPICIWMRSIASISEGRSSVACWATCVLPAKVTMPTWMSRGTSCRNALAAPDFGAVGQNLEPANDARCTLGSVGRLELSEVIEDAIDHPDVVDQTANVPFPLLP
jgi:hypothetical protein